MAIGTFSKLSAGAPRNPLSSLDCAIEFDDWKLEEGESTVVQVGG
jgi:hypothetical protein